MWPLVEKVWTPLHKIFLLIGYHDNLQFLPTAWSSYPCLLKHVIAPVLISFSCSVPELHTHTVSLLLEFQQIYKTKSRGNIQYFMNVWQPTVFILVTQPNKKLLLGWSFYRKDLFLGCTHLVSILWKQSLIIIKFLYHKIISMEA